ncbi:hypothetical protein CMZ84_00250 [Lysobacteraceae bacterium NML93-0399]|nr:hypothetical protein CMZ84_00250 [Xanthomonadaceae bacterium NML93-0399]
MCASFAALSAHAAPPRDPCAAQTLYALTHAGLVPAGDDAPLVAQACRVWPYDTALELAAVAYALPDSGKPGERALRLVVAVLDADDAQVLSSKVSELDEDAGFALGEGGLLLDTARYDLVPGDRAFGVVVRNTARGPSCPDRRYNDALTLYLRDGDALRPVVETHLDFWARVAGEPCSWARDQLLVTEEAAFTLAVLPTARHGMADLRVQADVVRLESVAGSDLDTQTRRRETRTVRYDGHRYDTGVLENGFFWHHDPEDP